MIKLLELTVEKIFYKSIKDKETGKESEIAKVLYVKEEEEEEDFYIGYISKYDANKLNIKKGLRVKAIFDKDKIKIVG